MRTGEETFESINVLALILVSLTHHALDDLILAVVLLHLEKMVAEVEDVKASVLSQEGDDHAAGPVEAVSEALPGKQEMERAG